MVRLMFKLHIPHHVCVKSKNSFMHVAVVELVKDFLLNLWQQTEIACHASSLRCTLAPSVKLAPCMHACRRTHARRRGIGTSLLMCPRLPAVSHHLDTDCALVGKHAQT